MTTMTTGTRVVAVCAADKAVVLLYGRGVYAGDFPRPGSGNWSVEDRALAEATIRESDAAGRTLEATREINAQLVARGESTQADADARIANAEVHFAKSIAERAEDLLRGMDLNPRIDLDAGGSVWGCECWWMPEEEFEAFVQGRTIEPVPFPRRAGE
ncbi:hypothetical protein ACIP9H_33875 [Streptomyces sp. NPDC088732]|uniref:hypothetical protein n=1 Tax=Streptomyces sp. NPDC088732 TaxID=3365879 RepID=UPI003811B669